MSKVELQERIKTAAITSFCVANSFVISAVLKHYAHKDDEIVLFEATSNQVNHLGGYTGMKPADYKQMVLDLAGKDDFSQDRIVFGGDHLGPLPFKHLDKDKAMKEAEKLVRSYVLAGFEKLHIDTSMSLGTERCLSNEEIAKRGVRLIAVAEDAFKQYSQSNANAIHPVYIIGSEVPPAGGKTNNEDSLKVTSFKEVKDVLSTYQAEFEKCGLNGIWKYVIGIVIQPGVEFGHTSVDHFIGNALDYDINKCQELGICFEAHSTDYQSKAELRQLVENNFLIDRGTFKA